MDDFRYLLPDGLQENFCILVVMSVIYDLNNSFLRLITTYTVLSILFLIGFPAPSTSPSPSPLNVDSPLFRRCPGHPFGQTEFVSH